MLPMTLSASAPIRLSVVVPNYNHGALIGNAIRAFASQNRPPDEIVIVDDASTDDSRDRLQRLSRELPSLRVIFLPENQGAIAALNHGLRSARGHYVNFGAADDVTHPGLFEAMLGALERHPAAAFACCEAMTLDLNTGETGYRPPVLPSFEEAYFSPYGAAGLLRRIDNLVLSGTAVARRDAVLAAGGLDPALRAFADGFLFRQLALQHGFCFAPGVGLTWRVSASGLSRSQAADLAGSLETLQVAADRMHADPSFPRWYPELFERRWRFAVARLAAKETPMNGATLDRLARGPIGRTILKLATRVGGAAGRFSAMAWLTLQEQPTSLTGLVQTRHFRHNRINLARSKG
ncbi:hypothetical protein DB459_17255 [Bradyrhizobium sp. WD16]|nr:hypothetical protein DB459_17255 [Bradyrhizobium sp. WD16]